jgi:uncharacterized protein YjiS (DUF1127 family)
MTAIRLKPPTPVGAGTLPAVQTTAKGGIFYRWHMRRQRIGELSLLLALDPALLDDIGVTRNEVEAEIATLRRAPV